MIDYTRAPEKVQRSTKGGARNQFDVVVLTAKDVPANRDVTAGAFYKAAEPNNSAARVYILSDITRAHDSASAYFIECKVGVVHKDPAQERTLYLRLEQSNVNTYGYKVTDIQHTPPRH